MNFFNHIKDAWQTVLANKMRSGLSSLGIIIGISSVVLILSAGQATKGQFMNNLGSVSTNSVSIIANNRDANNSAINLTLNDNLIDFLAKNFSFLSGAITSIRTSKGIRIKYNTNSDTATIQGVSQNYLSLSKEEFLYGQDFSFADFQEVKDVAIVNYFSLSEFFNNSNPIGRTLTIKGKPFTIIGVLKESTIERMGMNNGITITIPTPSYTKNITVGQKYDSLGIYLPEEFDNEEWRQILYYSLLQYLGVQNIKQANFTVDSLASFADQVQSAMDVFSYFLALIGGISLLVGGIGVMNIMIVSVTERTREIGIRKAIGALKKDIIMQFLTESIVLTTLGGIIAILISYFIISIANGIINSLNLTEGAFVGFHITIPINVLILAFTLTTLVGIGFGILPAKKAATLKPIDALRFE